MRGRKTFAVANLPLELLQNFQTKALESLGREPANLEEAMVRFMVVCGNQWMSCEEPVSTELDRLLDFYVASLDWGERSLVKPFLHGLRKTREGVRRARELSSTEGGIGTG